MEEDTLVKILQSGDREEFSRIIDAYNRLLWVIVGGVLNGIGTTGDIEECISDVYVSLWRKPKAYDPHKGSLKTFIAVKAKSMALDKYRQLTKMKIVELDEEIRASDDDLLEYIAKRDMFNELHEAISSLKEPDKEILVRRYFFDEKPSGIAGKTSLSVKEVENRLYQSKLKLRKILQTKEAADYGA